MDNATSVGQSAVVLVQCSDSDSDSDSVTLTLSISELMLVNNALNEVCNGVHELGHDGEFSTRLGESREVAKRLLAEVHSAIGHRS